MQSRLPHSWDFFHILGRLRPPAVVSIAARAPPSDRFLADYHGGPAVLFWLLVFEISGARSPINFGRELVVSVRCRQIWRHQRVKVQPRAASRSRAASVANAAGSTLAKPER